MTAALAARPIVHAVVLNWNQPALTLECVRHLGSLAPAGLGPVLVVDNGSTPENLAALSGGLPDGVELLRSGRNLGFAGGMNVGIARALGAGAGAVWLLNNDAFPRPGCLEALAEALAADATLAAVTPALFYPDGGRQAVGGRFALGSPAVAPLFAGQVPRGAEAGVYVTGAAPLVRAESLKRAGLFDERFFAYWEEVDLCARFARLGLGVGDVPEAECVHYEGATSGGARSVFAEYLTARNPYLLAYKHLPPRRAAAAATRLSLEIADRAVELRPFYPAVGGAMLAGVLAGLRRRFGPPPPTAALDAPRLRRALYWKPWRTTPLVRWVGARARVGYLPPAGG